MSWPLIFPGLRTSPAECVMISPGIISQTESYVIIPVKRLRENDTSSHQLLPAAGDYGEEDRSKIDPGFSLPGQGRGSRTLLSGADSRGGEVTGLPWGRASGYFFKRLSRKLLEPFVPLAPRLFFSIDGL